METENDRIIVIILGVIKMHMNNIGLCEKGFNALNNISFNNGK